MKLEKN